MFSLAQEAAIRPIHFALLALMYHQIAPTNHLLLLRLRLPLWDHRAQADEDTTTIITAIIITAIVVGVVRKKEMVHVAGREVKAADPGTIEQHILR
jgi:multisubunit Na+/H+ antiporter MnhC subunit